MQTERNPQAESDAGAQTGPVTRDQIRKSVHDLRNGMNTLMMNAAVLGARSGDVPESLRPFAVQIGTAGRSCSDELARLFALIEAYRAE